MAKMKKYRRLTFMEKRKVVDFIEEDVVTGDEKNDEGVPIKRVTTIGEYTQQVGEAVGIPDLSANTVRELITELGVQLISNGQMRVSGAMLAKRVSELAAHITKLEARIDLLETAARTSTVLTGHNVPSGKEDKYARMHIKRENK